MSLQPTVISPPPPFPFSYLMGLQAAFLQFLYKLCCQGAEISAADDNKADQKQKFNSKF